ncbi:hypothetical protein TB2_013731 [Malus domestica]
MEADERMLAPHSDLVGGSLPIEAAEMEDMDPPPVHFTWKLFNFTSLTAEKIYSPIFTAGDYKWRMQMFPRGNNVKGLSLFLDVAYSETLPHKWCKCAAFSLTVINQIDSTYSIEKGIFHFYHPYFLLAI